MLGPEAKIAVHSRYIYDLNHISIWGKSLVRFLLHRESGQGGKSFFDQKMTKVIKFFGGEGGGGGI